MDPDQDLGQRFRTTDTEVIDLYYDIIIMTASMTISYHNYYVPSIHTLMLLYPAPSLEIS